MTISLNGTVTGAVLTGMTSPTYTLSGETLQGNLKSAYVSAIGGTQAGVTAHSIAFPFRVEATSPANLSVPGAVNVLNGRMAKVAKNNYRFSIYKGAVPLSGQPAETAVLELSARIPAGAESADPMQLKAMVSFLAGFLAVQANRDGLVDTWISGVK